MLTDRRLLRIARRHELDPARFVRVAPAVSESLTPGLAVEYDGFPQVVLAYDRSDTRAFNTACRIIRSWLDADAAGVPWSWWLFGLNESPPGSGGEPDG